MSIDINAARAEVRAATRPATARIAAEFQELFNSIGAASLRRTGGPAHLTASCLVIDPRADAVLLNHHRKAGLWGQFGGHLEAADESLAAAARREAQEESGLRDFAWFSPTALDLHIHDLAENFGQCHRHYDVVHIAIADRAILPQASAESFAVQWFDNSALPRELMPDLPARLPDLFARGREAWISAQAQCS